MPKRDERFVEVFLASPQAASWRDRLTEVFFDADAREQILHEIRAGLRALDPALPAHEQAELQDLVLAALCSDASRRAVPPIRESDPPPSLFTGEALADQVIGAYPYPVARAYLALTEEEPGAGAFGCLLDTFESLVHFLATVAVSAYQRSGLALADCNRQLVDRFLKGAWATGDLFALLRDTIRLAGDCGGKLPYPELPGYLFKAGGKPTDSSRMLESFIALRNRKWGHGTGRTSATFAEALPVNRQRLERELARLHWLTSWQLIRPTTIDGSGQVTRADLLMGFRRRKNLDFSLQLQEHDLDVRGGSVRAEKSLLLVSPDRNHYLPLFPLSLFGLKPNQRDGVYLLQNCQWQRSTRLRRLEKAIYVAYEAGLDPHSEPANDLAASRIEQFLEQLAVGMGEHTTAALREVPAGPSEDPDYELPAVRVEQETHLRMFVGQEAVLQGVLDWIDRATEGGYLLLLGPPGQGKSALMAELARRETRPSRGGCLLHMVKSHRHPQRFVPALISQAAKLAKVRFGADAYRGDLQDLRNSLVRACGVLCERTGRALLILDALDELVTGDGAQSYDDPLSFLPAVLPPSVRAVLTCRPDIPLVQALRARLAGLQERTVPPFTEADFQLLLQRRLGASTVRCLEATTDLRAVFERGGGNPLFLRSAVERIADEVAQAGAAGREPRVDVADLPNSYAAFFWDLYHRKVSEKKGTRWTSAQGQSKARLLQLLCVARAPLTYDELAGLMAAAGSSLSLEDCRDRVDEMSQFLLDSGGGRFKPWHQGLVDYVRREVLGLDGVRQVEDIYCRWLNSIGGARYGLRHWQAHLLAASRLDEAAEQLVSLAYLETKAEAGLVFELAADFSTVLGKLPGDHPRRRLLRLLEEALRADIHFIQLHPTTLLQCLWNRCWWYDTPEAARHYEPPDGGWPADGPPWEQAGPKLHELLESWRATKEGVSPRCWWLRSLRPPPIHLGTAQRAVLQGHKARVRCVAFSPDSRFIASGSQDRTVRLWDVQSGRELACLRGHTLEVSSLAVSPDGRLLASGSHDGTVRVWDLQGPAQRFLYRGHGSDVTGVAFSPDGQRIASVAVDRTLRVWDAQSGSEVTCLSNRDRLFSAAFSPDGRAIVVGSDTAVQIWDSGAGVKLLHGHEGPVLSAVFSPTGERIVSGSVDRTIRVWDAQTGRELACWQGHKQSVRAVAVSPDGQRIASVSWDGTVRTWDARSYRELFCLRGHDGYVYAISFSPDGRYLVTGSADRTVRVWSAEGGASLARIRGPKGQISSLMFSPDGRCLVSGSADGTVRVWDVRTGGELFCLEGHKRHVSSVAFSPDGKRIASASWDSTVRIWDVESGMELACFGHFREELIQSVAFSVDAEKLLIKSNDDEVQTLNVQDGAILAKSRATADLPGGASKAASTRWHVVPKKRETVIQVPATGEAIAWFPVELHGLATHTSRQTWAGAAGKHLYLFTLEGKPDDVPG